MKYELPFNDSWIDIAKENPQLLEKYIKSEMNRRELQGKMELLCQESLEEDRRLGLADCEPTNNS